MIPIWVYLAIVALGFIIQSILSGISRMLFDLAIGFLAGLMGVAFSNFLLVAMCLGIFLKMFISGYLHCSYFMIIYIIAGAFIGYLMF